MNRAKLNELANALQELAQEQEDAVIQQVNSWQTTDWKEICDRIYREDPEHYPRDLQHWKPEEVVRMLWNDVCSLDRHAEDLRREIERLRGERAPQEIRAEDAWGIPIEGDPVPERRDTRMARLAAELRANDEWAILNPFLTGTTQEPEELP